MIPNNNDAERVVLGSLIIDPEGAWQLVADQLGSESFYTETHRWLFEAIKALHANRVSVDFVTLCDELARRGRLQELGGASAITSLFNATPTALNVEHYAKILVRDQALREQIAIGTELIQQAHDFEGDDPHALARVTIQKLLEITRNNQRGIKVHTIEDALYKLADKQKAIANGEKIPGFDPVLPPFRAAVRHGLWAPKSVVLIGANPGVGKSMYMLFAAMYNVLIRGQHGIYIGTEMPVDMVAERLAPMFARYAEFDALTNAVLEDAQGEHLVRSLADYIVEKCGSGSLLMVDEATTVEQFATIIQGEEAIGRPLDFCALDYLQMLGTEDAHFRGNETALMEYVGKVVRQTSVGTDTVLVSASSFTKGSETDPPTQQRFKQTSNFAHDAAVMIGMYILDNILMSKHVKIRSPSKVNMTGVNIPLRIHPDYGILQELTIEKVMLENDPDPLPPTDPWAVN